MVMMTGASERTIEALKKNGAKASRLGVRKHAVTFNEDEHLPETMVPQEQKKASKVKKENAKVAQAVKARKEAKYQTSIPTTEGPATVLNTIANPSRKDLIAEAQRRGIKYFRILTKEELIKVLTPETTKEEIKTITQAAIKKWKEGWTKGEK